MVTAGEHGNVSAGAKVMPVAVVVASHGLFVAPSFCCVVW